MRIIRETRTASVSASRQRRLEAVVQVRGLDARAAGRGFSYERHEPVSLIVHDDAAVTRIAFPDHSFNAASAAMPVAVYLLSRILLKRRRTP